MASAVPNKPSTKCTLRPKAPSGHAAGPRGLELPVESCQRLFKNTDAQARPVRTESESLRRSLSLGMLI